MKKLQELKELLAIPRTIAILTHHKPDGDALGSSLGLYHYFIQKGHQVTVISPTDYPSFLSWLPGSNTILNYETAKEESLRALQLAELIFITDLNKLSRMNELGEEVLCSSAKKILIDHHLEPDSFSDYRLWDPEASSTAELVYDFICLMGDKSLLSRQVAECLYVGIMTDTGSFRFERTTPKVHQIAAELLTIGVIPQEVHQKIFDTFSESRMRFLGFCLKDKLTVLPEYRTAYMAISAEEIRAYCLRTGDTEGLINLILAVEGVELAALIIDRTAPAAPQPLIKISFRSKSRFNVNDIAREYFNGGGHLHAAGGFSHNSLQETLEKFLSILPQYKQALVE